MDETGRLRKRIRKLPQAEWAVLIKEHHTGFIDWDTHEMNLARIKQNAHPRRHEAGGAVREGAALLQGIATCASCGRRLNVYYQGSNSTPGYYCPGNHIINGRGQWCMRVGGARIDKAVSAAFLEVVAPAGMQAALQAEEMIEPNMTVPWRNGGSRSSRPATRPNGLSVATDPWNRRTASSPEPWKPSGRSSSPS